MGLKAVKKQAKRALRARRLSRNRLQYGALCYRSAPDGSKVLLITSRRTRRWISPKGWPMRGKTPAQAAAQEAYEEAGVRDHVGPKALGFYSYRKVLDRKRQISCLVQVFPLEVTEQSAAFPEARDRQVKWMRPKKAAKRVREPELAAQIRQLDAQLSDKSK